MPFTGLSDSEVQERVSRGDVNKDDTKISRSYKDIIIGNAITPINLIIFAIGICLAVIGEKISTSIIYCGVIILNIIVATVQEIKAKKRLDAIALFLTPKATVIRNGKETVIQYDEIVLDDVIKISPGEQIFVDGILLEADYLELDESALTGESGSVKKRAGDMVVSGTFCVTGTAYFKAVALGKESVATKMMAGIKKTKAKHTPLQNELANVIKTMLTIAIVLVVLVSVSDIIRNLIATDAFLTDDWYQRLIYNIAFVFEVVPIILYLLLAITYVVSSVKMSDAGVMLQRSNSIESMNYVDTLCMDKTGTITTQKLLFNDIKYFADKNEADELIVQFANSTGSKNNTVMALLDKYGKKEVSAKEEIRFSSDRKYSAVKISLNGKDVCIYMGAPSVLGAHLDISDLKSMVSEYSVKGLRTVVVATSENVDLLADNFQIPSLKPIALVALEDELRPNCKRTIELFLNNDIDVKVISGDDPETVDALFKIIGITGERKTISGEELDRLSGTEKTKAILETTIFGRMKPNQKEEIIDTLKLNGRYVAMIGDGVNDVRSLKNANLSISLQGGSSAAKGVSDMVLANDDFAAIPTSLVEGRRTVSGMRNILKIYLSRNFILAILVFLIMIVAFGRTPYSIECNSVYGFLTVSVPALTMVFLAKPERNEESVLKSVLRYAVPMAIIIGIFGFVLYCSVILSCQFNLFTNIFTPGPTDEYNDASSILFVFLLYAGVLQLLFVMPYHKFFSLNGKVCDDVRPTILVVIGLILVTLLFVITANFDVVIMGVDIFRDFFLIPVLDPQDFVFPLIFVAIWFFVARAVMRSSVFDSLCDRIEAKFASSTEKYVVNNEKYEEMGMRDLIKESAGEFASVKDLIKKGKGDGKDKN